MLATMRASGVTFKAVPSSMGLSEDDFASIGEELDAGSYDRRVERVLHVMYLAALKLNEAVGERC